MEPINFNHSPLANSKPSKPTIDDVDRLAEALAIEFKNYNYRPWYAAVVTEYGVRQTNEFLVRARLGKAPGKLFTKLVNEDRGRKKGAAS